MREVLEPLGRIAGVRIAVLVSPDGVPVVVRGRRSQQDDLDELDDDLSGEGAESLAALASGWLHGLSRSVAPLSWESPASAVLRADRGTLVMLHAPGSVLLVLLDSGTQPEDLQLPMEGAVARIQRILRSNRDRVSQDAQDPDPHDPMIEGALPEPTVAERPRDASADSYSNASRRHPPR